MKYRLKCLDEDRQEFVEVPCTLAGENVIIEWGGDLVAVFYRSGWDLSQGDKDE